MTVREDAAALLKLPVAEYHSFDSEPRLALQRRLSALAAPPESDSDEEAPPPPFLLAIGAPDEVRLDDDAVVPVLIGTVRSGMRRWQVNPETNHHVLLRDMQSGQLRTAEPLYDARRGETPFLSGVGTPPDEFTAKCVTTAVDRFDLRGRISPILPGTYVVTVVEYEIPSNSVRFTATSHTPRPATAPVGPPAYVHSAADSREDLAELIEIPRTASRGAPIGVRLEMQVAAEFGVSTWRAEDGTPRWSWSCNLVLIQLDKRPVVVPVAGWVEPVGDRAHPTRYNAVFGLDLRAAVADLAGDYLVYLDTGDRLLGPYPMHVG